MGAPAGPPDRLTAFRYGLRLGCISFGGPAGQIAILHREVVEERGWVSEDEFLRGLNFCMLLPGPEALQLVIYLGWRWYGAIGAIVAGLCFLGPAALLLTGLAFVYVRFGTLVPIAAALAGLKAVVVALVLQALLRIGRRALRGPSHVVLALAAFIALAAFHAPFPAVIALAALAGLAFFRRPPAAASTAARAPAARATLATLAAGALLWLAAFACARLAPVGPLPARLFLFFTKAALVGFGGAYAVLSYVNAELVAHLGWLHAPDLVAGLALAETTPGPLVMTLPFYGFVTLWSAPGPLDAPVAALLGGGLACLATFLPSFVLVIALAPYVERLASLPPLAAALEGVTAAVVGVIGSFAVAVALAICLPRGPGAPDYAAIAIAVAAFAALTRTRIDLVWVLAGGALASLGLALA